MTEQAKKVAEWAKGSPDYARVDPALASVMSAGLAMSFALGLPELIGTDAATFAEVAFSAGAFLRLARAYFWPRPG